MINAHERYWKIMATYSNHGIHASYNIDTSIMVCCVLLIIRSSFRAICLRIFLATCRTSELRNAFKQIEKSVFCIASYPHSRPVELARLAKGRAAFNGGEDELIIRNSASVKIPQSPASLPRRERRVDRNIEPPRRRLLSAIPPIQKSEYLMEIQSRGLFSPFSSFSRRIYDQLSAINDNTNGLWKCTSTPRVRALRYTDWKYHHECATHARSISYITIPVHENYTNLVVFQKDESFKNFILVIF